jgi:molybdate transport system substrate-binding protein
VKRAIFATLIASAAALFAPGGHTAEVRVLTNPAYRPVLDALVPAWERASGNSVRVEQAIPADLLQRIASGVGFDIAVANASTIGRLEMEGKVVATAPVAAVGISLAVRSDAPRPDIASVAAFKETMLRARSVSLPDPGAPTSSGNYMLKVFARLGITAAMTPKLVIVRGGSAAEPVASGKAELALQQASELFDWEGVTVVGPIPAELQSRTAYLAGLSPQASESARSLHALLSGPEARAFLQAKPKGVEAP